ncbi:MULTISPECIES: ATP-binding protein [unclassified Streptomyces]|uniref:ATP-binding protein n=1 Tax=unclassified Streptomyces TaxID=2593676 RepID=UPI0038130CE8
MTPDQVVRRWSRHPRQVGRARAELRTALAGWALVPVTDTALLVLSELLTNAGRHARVSPGREIETRFVRLPDGVRIEVHDASSVRPVGREPALEADDGRGLFLVDALADRWGIADRNGPGKAVWAECRLPSQNGGGPDAV